MVTRRLAVLTMFRNLTIWPNYEMRVVLTTYGSRGDVQPLVGRAVQVRALGAEVQVCAPPDQEFADLLAGVGVPLVPIGGWR